MSSMRDKLQSREQKDNDDLSFMTSLYAYSLPVDKLLLPIHNRLQSYSLS